MMKKTTKKARRSPFADPRPPTIRDTLAEYLVEGDCVRTKRFNVTVARFSPNTAHFRAALEALINHGKRLDDTL